MADDTYKVGSLYVRDEPDYGWFEIGVEINGAEIPLSRPKRGNVLDLIQLADEKAEAEKSEKKKS